MLVIADSGPVIYLSCLGQLDLLKQMFGRVVVPRQVYEEVVDLGAGLPGSSELPAATWVDVEDVDEDDSLFQSLTELLDRGEAAALTLAEHRSADLVLVDERKGRQAAKRLGLAVRGTLGILVGAKRAGLIDAVGPLLQTLQENDFWMSADLRLQVLLAACEAANEPSE